MRLKPCETVETYKKKIEEVFKDYKNKAKVEDIYILPDYELFFEGAIDPKLADLHKTIHAQLQWKFEAVKHDVYYSMGVKSLYRAYSSDRVIEFVKTYPGACKTPIGQLTGLEAFTSYVKWYPCKENDMPGRQGVDGMYLLTKMPSTINMPGNLKHQLKLLLLLTIL